MKDKFIERLKELMEEKGVNINQLSKNIHYDFQAVARWLKGEYYPRHFVLIELSDYFNCSIDYILGLSEDYPIKSLKITSDFKSRLLFFLEKNKMSRYSLAKVCKIRESTISKWINEDRIPETSTLINLAALFGCTVDYLLGREY